MILLMLLRCYMICIHYNQTLLEKPLQYQKSNIEQIDNQFLKIDTSGSFDDYQKILGSKKRTKLRKRVSDTNNELGGIEFTHLEKNLIN